MKKVLGFITGVGLFGVIAGIGVVAMQPDTVSAERSVTVDASPEVVAPLMHDLRLVESWSPWSELDPDLEQEFSRPSHGIDAWYSWKGNDQTGEGKMVVVRAEPNEVEHRVEFYVPFEGVASSTLTWQAVGTDKTAVTWRFSQPSTFLLKAMNLAFDIEGSVGADYARGLANLEGIAAAAAAQTRMKLAEVERATDARLAEEAQEAAPEPDAPDVAAK